MIGGRDPISCVLLFVVSLTSPRLLLRLLSHSEAPFGHPRKLFWLRTLRSDSPLYFMSFGLLALCLTMTFRREPGYRIVFTSEARYEWENPYCSRTRHAEWLVLRWIQIFVWKCRLLLESSGLRGAPSPARLVSRNWTPMSVLLACVSSTTNACMTAVSRSQFDTPLTLTTGRYHALSPAEKYFRKECHNAVKPRAFTF